MEKFFKSKKTEKILSVLTLLFGIVALVMFFLQGVDFSNPIVWVMLVLVVSALLELLTISSK